VSNTAVVLAAAAAIIHVKQYNCIPHFILAATLTAAQIHVVHHSAGRAAFLPRLDPVRQNLVRVCCAVSGAVLGARARVHRVRAARLYFLHNNLPSGAALRVLVQLHGLIVQ
jgi:hypothetical protein